MSILTWFHKRSSRKRDRKYKALDDLFDEHVARLTSDDVVIDCGANRGAYTVRLARSGAEVHAFEPNPDAFAELERVTAPFANVELYQAAVTTTEGPVDLYLHKWAEDDPLYWSTGSSLLEEKSNVRRDKAITVEGVQMTRFIRELGRPVKLLKMDVEGAEVAVLNQLLDEDLQSAIGYAFVEVHDRRIPSLVEPTRRLRERLESLGATNFRLDWR